MICNEALARANYKARIDCRSLKARNIHRLPEPKQGAIAKKIERTGRASHAGKERRATKAYNGAVMHQNKKEQVQEVRQARRTLKRLRRKNINVTVWLLYRAALLMRKQHRKTDKTRLNHQWYKVQAVNETMYEDYQPEDSMTEPI